MTDSSLPHEQYISIGLNPTRSVVVEACAGSGKTWLLVSRLVRLLLAGARPGQVLAITYTRKAAREIEERLRQFLGELATAPKDQALRFLMERGLSATEADAALPMARGLLERVLQADPLMTVTTFHGWFAKLLAGAPLESGLAGMTLEDNTIALRDEAWAQLSAECAREYSIAAQAGSQASGAGCAQSLLWLYEHIGAYNTRKLLHALIERRAEWQAWCAVCGSQEAAIGQTVASFGLGGAEAVFARFFSTARRQDLAEYVEGLRQNGKKGADNAARIDMAWVCEDSMADAFECVRTGLLTSKNEPRVFTPVKALSASLAEKVQRLHKELCEATQDVLIAMDDVENAQLNRHALTVGVVLLENFQRLKRAHRVMDFTDLECEVDRLLADEECAAFIQARLDARYKHILLDEFQDTNPMQWRILRAWLDAYHVSGGSGVQKPTVFLVGDPKQSIYRFRRAEPRLFGAACVYFQKNYDAQMLMTDLTRRNAQTVVDLVNAVFEVEPSFQGNFRPQQTTSSSAGHVALRPRIAKKDKADDAIQIADVLRNPLQVAVEIEPDDRRSEESRLIVEGIRQMVGATGKPWSVMDKHSRTERAASYGDILILTRRKTILGELEAALREAAIPFVSPGRGGLLATLEAQDMVALMRFLADPADNLALAHVLRTPAFDVSDEMLLALSEKPDSLWWVSLAQRARQLPQSGFGSAYALLRDWVQASRYLPAHDVLDRIFHSADWMQRYRARVPPQMWPGVSANLEALLELTLTVDAGRYPSLSRLVDELRRLQEAGAEEAPDEGLIQTAQEAAGRVRIMTIHGSKGLEAPIVWLMDADGDGIRHDGYEIVLDWPADSSVPKHFSLLGRYGGRGVTRKDIFEQEEQAAKREDANLLYVAMTRAEQVFIASAVEGGRKGSEASHYDRLMVALQSQGGDESGGVGQLPLASRVHDDGEQPGLLENVSSVMACVPDLNVGSQRPVESDNSGQFFGRALHAWLEAVTEGLPPPALPHELSERVPEVAQRILDKPELRRFFDPQQYVQAANETALMGADGKLGRMDRWVEVMEEDGSETLWVLDYKSGKADEASLESYQDQLRTYGKTLRAIWPQKKLRGLLIFTGQDVEGVEVELV